MLIAKVDCIDEDTDLGIDYTGCTYMVDTARRHGKVPLFTEFDEAVEYLKGSSERWETVFEDYWKHGKRIDMGFGRSWDYENIGGEWNTED
jgi:hypothetical protein